MPRYTIGGFPIHIAYGSNEVCGIFPSTFDDRLSYDESASNDVKDVTILLLGLKMVRIKRL